MDFPGSASISFFGYCHAVCSAQDFPAEKCNTTLDTCNFSGKLTIMFWTGKATEPRAKAYSCPCLLAGLNLQCTKCNKSSCGLLNSPGPGELGRNPCDGIDLSVVVSIRCQHSKRAAHPLASSGQKLFGYVNPYLGMITYWIRIRITYGRSRRRYIYT